MNISIIYSPDHQLHNPPFEIYDGVKEPYAEKAERIESIVQFFKDKGFRSFVKPSLFSDKHVLNAHHPAYVDFISRRSQQLATGEVLYPSYFIMDTYTPLMAKTYQAARMAVNVALTGARKVLRGEKMVYALSRPPGHHACTHTMGGYCYFNNAAIAAQYLSKHGKVAILDIDFHHGNGTQEIFYDRSDVLYVSLHADPRVKFPYSTGFKDERGRGDGYGFNKNYPLPIGTSNQKYLPILRKALQDIQKFQPKFLVVSAGFDTYQKDPIGGFTLTIPFYEKLGQEIAALELPTLIVQEGGYHVADLGKIAHRFLQGFSGQH